MVALIEMVEHQEPDGDVEQSETHNGETHHGTATEGYLQSSIHTLAGGIGCAGRGVGGGLHAEETGQSGEETASEEGEGHPGILHVQAIGHEGEERTEDDKHDGDDLVLLLEVSHCTFAHIERNFFHTRRTFVGLHHLSEEVVRHTECHDRCEGHKPEYCWNVHCHLIFLV